MQIMTLFKRIFNCENILFLKIKIIFIFFIAFFLLLTCARLGTFLAASNYFQELTLKQVILSFLHGTRFDLHIIAILVCPFFILLLLPFKNKTLIKCFVNGFIVLFFSLTLFLIADIIFFSIFNNHLGIEILTCFTHIGLFVSMAFQTYHYVTIPIIIVMGIIFYFVNKYCNKSYPTGSNKHFVLNSILTIIILLPFMFFMLKGKLQLQGRNIGLMDAQAMGVPKTSDLIINAPYTAINAVHGRETRNLYFDDPFANLDIVTSQETLPDNNFPFERKRITFNKQNNNYNFVLFILESFDPVLIDKYPEAIPNFIALKEKGSYYKNFFSSGMRSLIGVTATLFSTPYVWSMPTMKNGLGGKEFSRLAQIFKNKDYTTLNIITDIPNSDNANLIASYMGFDYFYSKQDIPLHHDYPLFHKGFDYEGLEFLNNKIKELNNKFFAYFYKCV